jgi:PS-10 peptidase S37
VLVYEHRFFGTSRPEPIDWSQLTIRQAADDAHAMVEALRWIFRGRWINAGVSKGGMTSVYHRRFYPCDVDGTVAFSAPLSIGTADPAYDEFLRRVGGDEWSACRASIVAVQRRLLQERSQVQPLVYGQFTIIPAEKAYELAVVELPFAFWQYSGPSDYSFGCGTEPRPDAPALDLANFLQRHSSPSELAGDEALATYAPYYVQSQRQLGAPSPPESGVSDLLRWPGADTPTTYLPPGIPVQTYEPDAMADINEWLDVHGDRVMLVYGEFDPWSARKIPLGRATDSYAYVVPAGNHGARLSSLAPDDQTKAFVTLNGWLDRQPVGMPKRRQVVEPAPPRFPR